MQAKSLPKTLVSAILFGFLITVSSFVAVAQSGARQLVLLNWSEYLDPELIGKFQKQFNAQIKEVYFESDDLRDTLLLETDATGYDLAVVNGIAVDTYRQRGWLAAVDHDKVPNLKYIDDRWLDAFDGARGHVVPYFWGTLGIGYRADMVERAPTSWMDLMKPPESMRGKIGMVEASRDALGMALKALGHSANSVDFKAIEEAEQLLLAQKPYVKTYTYVALSEESALVKGEMAMTMLYSGDALMVQEHHDQIVYVVPKEGGNLWVDYLAVLEKSKNKDLAWAFINFLNEPENAAQLAQFVYYATPNKAAEKLLPKEFLEDEIIYPSAEVIAKSEPYAPLPPRTQRKRALAFARVMQ